MPKIQIPGEASMLVDIRRAMKSVDQSADSPMGRLARRVESGYNPLTGKPTIDVLEGLLSLKLADPTRRKIRDMLQGSRRSADVQATLFPGRRGLSREEVEALRPKKSRTSIYE